MQAEGGQGKRVGRRSPSPPRQSRTRTCKQNVTLQRVPRLPPHVHPPGQTGWEASGVPVSQASRVKTAFHIHGCFLRKGRKASRGEGKAKEEGAPFVSVSNMVSFDFSFSIVKGSPGVLICYQAGLYLPACVKVAQLLPGMRGTHHIYLPGVY